MSRWYKIAAVIGAVLASGYMARADLMDGAMAVARNITPPNIQTLNYPIVVSDCLRPMVQMGTGTTGQLTVTLPASSSVPSGCLVRVKNGDTTRGKNLSNFPSDLYPILWPQQVLEIVATQSGWQTALNPGRWVPNAGINFKVDTSNGSDSNDCLAGTIGACATIQQAINLACFQVDSGSRVPEVDVAIGTYSAAAPIQLVTQCVGQNCIHLVGDAVNNPPQVILQATSGGQDVYAKDKGCLTISGFTFHATVSSVNGISCGQNAIIDADHVAFGHLPGGNMVAAIDNCEINLNTNVTLNDNNSGSSANAIFTSQQFGRIQLNTNVTITGTFNFTGDACLATNSGLINLESSTISGGTVTGNKYLAQTGGGIVGGVAQCPGNGTTTTTSPGYSN